MSTLPVASAAEVRAHARALALRHPRALAGSVSLHALATISGLAVPWLIGRLVERHDKVDQIALSVLGFLILQAVLTSVALYASARLGERVLADLRETFIGTVLRLPQGTVERASTGDLVTRTTRDIDMLSRCVRLAVPDSLVAVSTILLTIGALVLVDPLLALPCLIAVPPLYFASRWYRGRSRAGYLRSNASYTDLTEGLAETVAGARTVEAFGAHDQRLARVDHDIADSYAAERFTLRLRSIYLPIADTAYILPVVATLVIGGMLSLHGVVSLGAATAATLYVQQILDPVDRLLYWLDELQIGGASLARLLGVRGDKPTSTGATPADNAIRVHDVSFGYRDGHDVLHEVALDVAPGERLAIVGPSGAGKSTLGRLLAGIHQPRSGSVTVGGVPLSEVDNPRGEVALVTQEHHVFRGSLRDNLSIAKSAASDEELVAALRSVDAWDWAEDLGFDTAIGVPLSPGQAQQLALARIVLADPHTLILDEATSVLDPSAARHLERSLAAVLRGRTVIAIAHRLHTARDADRVAVMMGGRITELGTHDELVAREGDYARLWASWRGARDTGSVGLGSGGPTRCDDALRHSRTTTR
ncbi:putative ABC transporter [Alloactinosynnema sp. L-07]|uniref:ABC transporter ATP-binding protein n=1 Tax=Alloactinosynnema sp. L-07 TaxID=1653480 RepID=UPI00065EEF93|nr:ABC transporter ATP-binding protein [Alloactinosynnema sp. L-07]CRK57543.1 putative ABC transporter [Alloactinosynnema sp. L-07]